jgi:predicted Zn-ribbon and HTH transcriptional regulator
LSDATVELESRLHTHIKISIKCPTCGDLGPDSSDKYYGYHLVVNDMQSKSKCRRCGVNFSYKHIGSVKTKGEILSLILEESID